MMKIGVCSVNSGPYTTRTALDSVAELAEEFGVDSVWGVRASGPRRPRQPPSPMDPGDPILDPVTTLAFLAGRTSSVRLGSLLRAAGRVVVRRDDLGPLEITITPPGDVDVATAADYADLGVDRLNLMLPWDPPEGGLASLFAQVVRPLVEAYRK